MVDELTPEEQQVIVPVAEPVGGIRAFAATTLGKVVIALVALTVVGTLLAVVAVVVLGFLGARVAEDAIQQIAAELPAAVTSTATPASGAGTAADEATEAPSAVPNSEVYAFRDVFVPLLSMFEPDQTEATTSTTLYIPYTLYLIDIVTEDGVRKAVLLWNDVRYTLPAGGTIPQSPWLVVEVRDDSVLMLYGDTTITLYVGQGMAAK